MHNLSRFYLYFGGIILVTTVIVFLYKLLFGEMFQFGQWFAALALGATGTTFMSIGHQMSVKWHKEIAKAVRELGPNNGINK